MFMVQENEKVKINGPQGMEQGGGYVCVGVLRKKGFVISCPRPQVGIKV